MRCVVAVCKHVQDRGPSSPVLGVGQQMLEQYPFVLWCVRVQGACGRFKEHVLCAATSASILPGLGLRYPVIVLVSPALAFRATQSECSRTLSQAVSPFSLCSCYQHAVACLCDLIFLHSGVCRPSNLAASHPTPSPGVLFL